ncbi:MAG: histidine kinase [Flavobacteriaceae bacterium]|nr:histidine kinase [Flavobacteriaceae bacterium]MCI5088981.1 histidine kinase [Flavobacteriaceae bacterium]
MIADKDIEALLAPSNYGSKYTITKRHHVIFWTIYILFNTLRWGSYFDDYTYSLKTNLLGFPIHMALAYLNVYVLMPKFVYKRKYLSYAVLVFLALFLMLLVKYYLTYYLVSTNVWPEGPEEPNGLNLNYAVQMMLGEFYVVAFVTAIKVTIDWLGENDRFNELEKRQLATELRFLRTQVSPHFFFNTLNNIYALTLSKSDKAPEVVLKLSDLIRYLLYATKKRKQDLGLELQSIQNYIDLERIRFNEELHISVSIQGNPKHKKIAPMLLMPFVENAFKHGANHLIGAAEIILEASMEGDFLNFKIQNTIPAKTSKTKKDIKNSGIGLTNVKKRLELGYSAKDYELTTKETNQLYSVELKIKV